MRCLALFRTKSFVFTEHMLQSKGIEPVNQIYLLGSLSQNQLRFVRHVVLERMSFLLSSVGRGLHRSFTIPKLQYLTTINIYATFVAVLAHNYELAERKSWMSWIERYVRLNNSGIGSPPFTNYFLKQHSKHSEYPGGFITQYWTYFLYFGVWSHSNFIINILQRILSTPWDLVSQFA